MREKISQIQHLSLLKILRLPIAFLTPLVVYLLTLAPTVVALDSAELTTAAATLGISRSTGYPLYILIGQVFSHLPLGDVAYRLNLLSAVMGALTILLLDLVFQKLGIKALPSLAAAGLLAFSPYFWSLSLVAEVYTLNTALITASLLAALHWIEKPGQKRLTLLGLSFGLGLAHHGSFALAMPGLLLLPLASRPRCFLRPLALLGLMGAGAAGLLFYLYLPLRFAANPAFNYAGRFDGLGVFHPVNLTTLSGLWWLVSGQAFAGSMFSYSLAGLIAQAQVFLAQAGRGFLFVGLGPAILGSVLAFKKSLALGAALLLLFFFNLIFYLDYDLLDKATMFLPAYLALCLWIGLGFNFLLDWVRKETSEAKTCHREAAVWSLRILMLATVGTACLFTWAGVDRSGDWSARQRGEQVLQSLEPSAIVVGYWDLIPTLQYLTLVEGRRSDLLLINRFLISDRDLDRLIAGQTGKRPFYIVDRPDTLPDDVTAVQSASSLIELQRKPSP